MTQQPPWPLYDLVLDVPHPAGSSSCPRPFLIGTPPPSSDQAPLQLLDPKELTASLPQIARFAFPEFDEAAERPPPQTQQQHLNRYDKYAMQNKSFVHFTFSMQLASGVRLHGHVRRYLPPHLAARSRYDTGRRGERALVVLTRATGADLLYAAILKSIEAISSLQAALPHQLQPHPEPQKWFLYQLYQHHLYLSQVYASKPQQERGKPLIANVEGIEVGTFSPLYRSVDSSRFMIPTCLLYKCAMTDPSATQSTSILPLLRCVGVAHTLRIMTALLSERRVVLVSSSPTRLASCSHAAVSMLAQGLLHWQHLFIPVLPPHLWQYLAAPYPYLLGVLAPMVQRLERTEGLGEVLIVHLDSNNLETRGIEPQSIKSRLPDLFFNIQDQIQAAAFSTPPEMLAQDLSEVVKADKKAMYGESTLGNVGETAAKATKVVKQTFKKLTERGRQGLQFLQQRSSGGGGGDKSPPLPDEAETEHVSTVEAKSIESDYIHTESCHNEAGEQDARVAFASFFICLVGDMRLYLTLSPGQQVPVLDRQKFLAQKRELGEGEGTAMWPLLVNFCQTQMLEEFVAARIEEIRNRQPVTLDAPLFLQCTNYHRQNNVDFGVLSVRRVSKQIAESNPSRLIGLLQINARRMAMNLTSNKAYDANSSRSIADLVDHCRESSSVLFDVMSVIWLRLRDCKGMQWKHGYQGLQILRNLLYHGPLAAVAEATDGLDKIRALKYYENSFRSQVVHQVRTAAAIVYNLLVDRAKLFQIRRVCAERRRELQHPRKHMRNQKMHLNVPFRHLHAIAYSDSSGYTAVPPPEAAQTPAQSSGQQSSSEVDFFDSADSQRQVLSSSASSFVSSTTPSASASSSHDLLGVFVDMTVSPSTTLGQPQPPPAVTPMPVQAPALMAPAAPAPIYSQTLRPNPSAPVGVINQHQQPVLMGTFIPNAASAPAGLINQHQQPVPSRAVPPPQPPPPLAASPQQVRYAYPAPLQPSQAHPHPGQMAVPMMQQHPVPVQGGLPSSAPAHGPPNLVPGQQYLAQPFVQQQQQQPFVQQQQQLPRTAAPPNLRQFDPFA